jgi:putative ABC transport system permease protein
MGLPLLAGRPFTPRDGAAAPGVVIVNQSLATRVFGGRTPLGERVWFEFFTGQPRLEVVGVVADEQFEDIDRDPSPVVYFPLAQNPSNTFGVVLRTAGTSLAIADVRRAASTIDPELPLFSVATLPQIIDGSAAVFYRRGVLWLLVVFAAASLLLAMVAVQGVVAAAVTRRRAEIGVRLALGASRRDILRLTIREGLAPALAGIVVGVGVSAVATRVLGSLLFRVGPTDPLTFAAAAGLLCAIATLACLLPARRAMRIDPAAALRHD